MTLILERPTVGQEARSRSRPVVSEATLRLLASPPAGDAWLCLLLAVGGQLDEMGCAQVRRRLQLLAGSGHDVALDLTGVDAADESLPALLAECQAIAVPRRVTVVTTSPAAARALAGATLG